MELIDGKTVAAALKQRMAERVAAMERKPYLVAILVGHDGASETYVGHKERACREIGFRSTVLRFEEDITEEALLG